MYKADRDVRARKNEVLLNGSEDRPPDDARCAQMKN